MQRSMNKHGPGPGAEKPLAGRQASNGVIGFIVILSVGFLLTAAILLEQNEDPLRGCLERRIDEEIARCEPAAWIYSGGADVAALNEQAVEKARFLAGNREALITMMVEEGLGKDREKIHAFLHRAAQDASRFTFVKGERGFREASTGPIGPRLPVTK